MTYFTSALWAETLKVIRSKALLFTALGFSMAPIVGGLFMIIVRDPEAARSMGLISAKAQIAMGAADWPTFFSFEAQAVAAGGMVLLVANSPTILSRNCWHCQLRVKQLSPPSSSSLLCGRLP